MKQFEMSRKKQVVFVDYKPETPTNSETNDEVLQNSIIVGKMGIATTNRRSSLRPSINFSNLQTRRSSIKPNGTIPKVKPSIATNKPIIDRSIENVLQSSPINTPTQKEVKSKLIQQQSLNETVKSELEILSKIYPSIPMIENDEVKVNQETIDLLTKIKQSASASSIGPVPLSQQACRFELPYDLKLLETFTPLDYITKYCRLSSRRQYQFKRLFHKYRNKRHLFEISDLFSSIRDIHQENFTKVKYTNLCQLLDLTNQNYEFTFETYAGILAFCERMLYNSSPYYNNCDDEQLTKDVIEKCDFDSLDRKLDGLNISPIMKRLLHTL